MGDNGKVDPGPTNVAWVWEIHKNCDSLLHQRLQSFTATQAMTLAAFTLLTIARFNATNMPDFRLTLLDYSRILVACFGLLTAVYGWLVTYPMFKRLQYLNLTLTADPTYKSYIDAADTTMKVPFVRIDFPLRIYRNVIPIWLPLTELGLWIGLIVFTVVAVLHAS